MFSLQQVRSFARLQRHVCSQLSNYESVLLSTNIEYVSLKALYNAYRSPHLVQLAEAFHVEVSRIPRMLQADCHGRIYYKIQRYAVGLVLLSSLGNLIRRRQLLLVLVFTSRSLSVGLALTKSIVGFEILSFFVAISSATPLVCVAARLTNAQRKLIGSKALMPPHP